MSVVFTRFTLEIFLTWDTATPVTNNITDNKNDSNTRTDDNNAPEELILDREAVPHIVSYFDLPDSAQSDLYRALDQTSNRLSNN